MTFQEFIDINRPKEIDVKVGNILKTITWNEGIKLTCDSEQILIFTPVLIAGGIFFTDNSIKEFFSVDSIEIKLPEPIISYYLSDKIDNEDIIYPTIEFISIAKEKLDKLDKLK